jgi:hypothetical protein
MISAARVKRLSATSLLCLAWSIAGAAAGACLDHSHSASGTGITGDALAKARKNWTTSVKADDGAGWARIGNARNPKQTCVLKNPSTGLKVCTFKATPCKGG